MTGKISDLAPNTNDKRKEEYIITGSISACKPPIYDGNCFENQRCKMSNYDGKIKPLPQWYHNQGDAKYMSSDKPDTYLWLAEENTKQAKKIERLQEQLKEANEVIESLRTYDFTVDDENAEHYQVKWNVEAKRFYKNRKWGVK